jgi:hypothetical protein
MKKSLLLLTTLLTFNMSTLSAAEGVADSAAAGGVALGEVAVVVNSAVPASRPAASAADLDRIKAHILGYAGKFGLPAEVETVGSTGCFACCSTTFDAAQRFLLNDLAGQLLTRFLALALADLEDDGSLDGIAYGKKISYSQEIASLLGVEISEEELRATIHVDASLLERVGRFASDVSGLILTHGTTKDGLLAAASAFAKTKMDRARKSLAVALVRESDRIIGLELGNGKIDGLDERGMAIDWKKEMETSIRNSLSIVLDGVL